MGQKTRNKIVAKAIFFELTENGTTSNISIADNDGSINRGVSNLMIIGLE
jgi:hypothetical protein